MNLLPLPEFNLVEQEHEKEPRNEDDLMRWWKERCLFIPKSGKFSKERLSDCILQKLTYKVVDNCTAKDLKQLFPYFILVLLFSPLKKRHGK